MIRKISLGGRTIEYEYEKKKIKNLNLRIRDGRVFLSVPIGTLDKSSEAFLLSKESFVLSALEKQEQKSRLPSLFDEGFPENKKTYRLFGRLVSVLLSEGNSPHIEYDNEAVKFVFSSSQKSLKKLKKEFYIAASEIIRERFDKGFENFCQFVSFLPEKDVQKTDFAKNHREKPHLRFRLMTSRWGSCTPKKNSITLNLALIEKDIGISDYIIAHELVHLLAPNHSGVFHKYLDMLMPDNKERRKKLNGI